MGSYVITFRSVTLGQRGERVINGSGIRCSLYRTPRWMEEQGCGYALRLWTKDISRAAALLRENQVPMRRIYLQKTDGQMEEVPV